MRTIKEINGKIRDNEKLLRIGLSVYSKKRVENIRLENEMYQSVVWYLESEPSEENLRKKKDQLEKLLKSKNSQFYTWRENTPEAKDGAKTKGELESMFREQHGIDIIEKQIYTLKFILNP